MYMCYDAGSDNEKRSTKGIPHSTRIDLNQFKSCLLNQAEQHRFETCNLRLDKNKQMARVKTTKNGLSDIFLKMQVSCDRVTCRPIRLNGDPL